MVSEDADWVEGVGGWEMTWSSWRGDEVPETGFITILSCLPQHLKTLA